MSVRMTNSHTKWTVGIDICRSMLLLVLSFCCLSFVIEAQLCAVIVDCVSMVVVEYPFKAQPLLHLASKDHSISVNWGASGLDVTWQDQCISWSHSHFWTSVSLESFPGTVLCRPLHKHARHCRCVDSSQGELLPFLRKASVSSFSYQVAGCSVWEMMSQWLLRFGVFHWESVKCYHGPCCGSREPTYSFRPWVPSFDIWQGTQQKWRFFLLEHLSPPRSYDPLSMLLLILLTEIFIRSLGASVHVGYINWLYHVSRPHSLAALVQRSVSLCFGGWCCHIIPMALWLCNSDSYQTAHSVRRFFPSGLSFQGVLSVSLLTPRQLSQQHK